MAANLRSTLRYVFRTDYFELTVRSTGRLYSTEYSVRRVLSHMMVRYGMQVPEH